jgi:hypothetical protein
MGFETTGIVSEEGANYGMAKDVDHEFYIKGKSWGGYKAGTKELEPVSDTIVKVSNKIRNFGDNAIAVDEGEAASKLGKTVEFTPAEMDHAKAIVKAAKQGKPGHRSVKTEHTVSWDGVTYQLTSPVKYSIHGQKIEFRTYQDLS